MSTVKSLEGWIGLGYRILHATCGGYPATLVHPADTHRIKLETEAESQKWLPIMVQHLAVAMEAADEAHEAAWAPAEHGGLEAVEPATLELEEVIEAVVPPALPELSPASLCDLAVTAEVLPEFLEPSFIHECYTPQELDKASVNHWVPFPAMKTKMKYVPFHEATRTDELKSQITQYLTFSNKRTCRFDMHNPNSLRTIAKNHSHRDVDILLQDGERVFILIEIKHASFQAG